jgi:hypothetical protein
MQDIFAVKNLKTEDGELFENGRICLMHRPLVKCVYLGGVDPKRLRRTRGAQIYINIRMLNPVEENIVTRAHRYTHGIINLAHSSCCICAERTKPVVIAQEVKCVG